MEFLVDFAQMRIGNMRVYLRRIDRRMAEHLLHGAYIGTVIQQISGE